MAFPAADKWEPGIYFGLPEKLYHSLPWLGSGDIKTLASIPQDYWAGSAMNELRDLDEDDDDTPARLFGRAIHDCVLLGEPTYLRRYGFIQDDTTKTGPSAKGIQQWIMAQGAEPRKLKEENLRYIKETWDMELVTERQNAQILKAARSIKANPYLAQAFTGGFPEVSIFWIDPETGAPCKCRIDYLKIAASVDLKSIRKQNGFLSFTQLCLKAIYRDWRYDVQACHYMDGRLKARELLNAGKVFWPDTPGFQRPADDWLAKCFNNETPGWAFVFYKAAGAPVARSVQCGFGGHMLSSGIFLMKQGRANYADMMEKYGTNIWVDTGEPIDADDAESEKYWTL